MPQKKQSPRAAYLIVQKIFNGAFWVSEAKFCSSVGKCRVLRIKLGREFVYYALGIISPAKLYRTCFSQLLNVSCLVTYPALAWGIDLATCTS